MSGVLGDGDGLRQRAAQRSRAWRPGRVRGRLACTARAGSRWQPGWKRSPKLRGLVEEQRRAIAAIETLDVRAPAPLRARLRTVRTAARRRARFRNLRVRRWRRGGGRGGVRGGGGPRRWAGSSELRRGRRRRAARADRARAAHGRRRPGPARRVDQRCGLSRLLTDLRLAACGRAGGSSSTVAGPRTVYYRHGGREVAYTIVGRAPRLAGGARTTSATDRAALARRRRGERGHWLRMATPACSRARTRGRRRCASLPLGWARAARSVRSAGAAWR